MLISCHACQDVSVVNVGITHGSFVEEQQKTERCCIQGEMLMAQEMGNTGNQKSISQVPKCTRPDTAAIVPHGIYATGGARL